MNTLWKGVAIAGIWLAIAWVGQKDPMSLLVTGIFAMLATFAVAGK